MSDTSKSVVSCADPQIFPGEGGYWSLCSIGENRAHQRPNWDNLPRKNARPLPPALDPRMVHGRFITSTTGRSPLHVDCWSTWKYNHVGHLRRLIFGTAVTAGGIPHIWIVHVKVSVCQGVWLVKRKSSWSQTSDYYSATCMY